MATLSLKGFLTSVKPVQEVGDNKTKIQLAYLKVPAYTDEFGEKKGTDEIWEFKAVGDNVIKLGLPVGDYENKKVNVKLYINSRMFHKKEDTEKKEPLFNIEAIIASVEFL